MNAVPAWYRVQMSPSDVVLRRAIQMQDAFEAIFMAHGGPADAAMCGGMDDTRNDYFFSPGAAAIAIDVIRTFGGAEFPAPKRSAVALLVCNYGAESVPFAPE
jgi:hypothetical protein